MTQAKSATGVANTTNMSEIAMTPTADQQAKNIKEREQALLRAGVPLDASPANAAGVKSYYHRFPGARTHLADGTEITFNAYRLTPEQLVGVFRTNDPEAIAHLDKIVDRPGTQVFSHDEIPVDAALSAVAKQAADTKGNAPEAGK